MRSKTTPAQSSTNQSQASSFRFFKAAVIGMFYWNPTSQKDVQDTIAHSRKMHLESQELIRRLDRSLEDTAQQIERLQKF